MTYSVSNDTFTVTLSLTKLGEDYVAQLSGGPAPRIDSVVFSVPRPSLSDENVTTCTSSVINQSSCLYEDACRFVAESLCCHYEKTVVCTGGIDNAEVSAEKMEQIRYMVYQLVTQATAAAS